MKGDKERLIRKPGSFEMTKFLNQKLISQYHPSKKYSGEAKIQLDEHTTGYVTISGNNRRQKYFETIQKYLNTLNRLD